MCDADLLWLQSNIKQNKVGNDKQTVTGRRGRERGSRREGERRLMKGEELGGGQMKGGG